MRIGLYPGTFDPITFGHLDIIERGAKLVDHLIVGVSTNPSKKTLFSLEERIDIVRRETAHLGEKTGSTIEVTGFDTLLMTYAEQVNASVIIRGLRAASDFEYEFQMTCMNARLNPNIETVFLTASEDTHFISSRFVKQIARLGGDISSFVSPNIAEHLRDYYTTDS